MWMDWLLLEDKIGKCLKIQLITNNTSVVKEEDESEEMAEKIPYKQKNRMTVLISDQLRLPVESSKHITGHIIDKRHHLWRG